MPRRKIQISQERSDMAKASSAHSRINIPLNLNNWQDVDGRFHDDLLWFHQYILDNNMSSKEVEVAVDYDYSSIFKFLKGISNGSYANFSKAIQKYRKLVELRKSIKSTAFVHTPITDLVFATLDYTYANRCMSLIVGESCMGKSVTMQAWRDANNHGKSVYVDCPPAGGLKGFLAAVAAKVGVNKNMPIPQMLDAIYRSFDADRILLLDNMHRACPNDGRSTPKLFDTIQCIFDTCGCAIALSATRRLSANMRHSDYMFEQIEGRIGTPIYLPYTLKFDDAAPIVAQYFTNPSAELKREVVGIINEFGRIRQLCERLKLASKIAAEDQEELCEKHFFLAVKVRKQLSKYSERGENIKKKGK